MNFMMLSLIYLRTLVIQYVPNVKKEGRELKNLGTGLFIIVSNLHECIH